MIPCTVKDCLYKGTGVERWIIYLETKTLHKDMEGCMEQDSSQQSINQRHGSTVCDLQNTLWWWLFISGPLQGKHLKTPIVSIVNLDAFKSLCPTASYRRMIEDRGIFGLDSKCIKQNQRGKAELA